MKTQAAYIKIYENLFVHAIYNNLSYCPWSKKSTTATISFKEEFYFYIWIRFPIRTLLVYYKNKITMNTHT